MRRALIVLLALAPLAAGCARGRGGLFAMDPFHPLDDRELERALGGFPSPGANVSNEIHDATGAAVARPSGLAFAEEVVSYSMGVPEPIPEACDPRAALGEPDYIVDVHHAPRAVSLGNGGTIILRLGGRGLGDVPGPDLFVFEIGPSVEAATVDVSIDGKTWIAVGEAPGGASAIDIGPYVDRDAIYRFVRIKDVPHQGGESDFWPGADIDAVGALAGEVERVEIPSEVLFEFDSDTLGSDAPEALERVAKAIAKHPAGARVSVEGHTDDVGRTDYNLALSERRARAVATFLTGRGIDAARLTVVGRGDSRPAAPNDSDEHRKKNRRVEIVIHDTP